MTKKNHPRFSLSKKPPQTSTLFSLIVNHKISCINYFNINNKYIIKNTNNSKLIVQKRDVKTYSILSIRNQKHTAGCFEYFIDNNFIMYVSIIFIKESKTTKMLVKPVFSFGSVINSLSSSRFINYTQPTTYSGKTNTENNSSDYLWTTLNFEEDYNSGDDQRLEVEEGTSEKNPVTQENDSLYRHILELLSPYSPEQKQASKDEP